REPRDLGRRAGLDPGAERVAFGDRTIALGLQLLARLRRLALVLARIREALLDLRDLLLQMTDAAERALARGLCACRLLGGILDDLVGLDGRGRRFRRGALLLLLACACVRVVELRDDRLHQLRCQLSRGLAAAAKQRPGEIAQRILRL